MFQQEVVFAWRLLIPTINNPPQLSDARARVSYKRG